MSWPSAQEYNEAIQNPSLCFVDPLLKKGSARKNALGLPCAVSGGFANVYELFVPGSGTWAIRCFIREVKDQQYRYTEIAKTLSAVKLPFTVEFSYQPQGIWVSGSVRPIVKMEWLKGDQLGDYIRKYANDSGRMYALAKKWDSMVAGLRKHGLAHGDLQHGNVLVVDDDLKLIDYDGVFVPALRGSRANEVGHPNYQHPKRSEADFGPFTDNFSTWVIYASIRILAVAPDTLDLVRGLGRDECILFNKEDFVNPVTSPFLGSLRLHPNPTVKASAGKIEQLLSLSPSHVPALDADALGDNERLESTVVVGPSDWWKEQTQDGGQKSRTESRNASEKLERSACVRFSTNTRAEVELFIFVCGSLMAFFTLSGPIGWAGYAILQVGILVGAHQRMRTLFLRCPETKERDSILAEVSQKKTEHRQIVTKREICVEKLRDLQSRSAALMAQVLKERAAVTLRQGVEIKDAHTAGAVARSELEKRQRQLDDEERMALTATLSARERELQLLKQQLAELDSQRASQLRARLEQYQQEELNGLLRNHPISGVALPGIGDGFKRKLGGYGIVTAANVERWAVRRIKGFGEARTKALLNWRESLTNHYSSRIPTILPSAELLHFERAFRVQKDELAGKIRQVSQTIDGTKQQIASQFAARKVALTAEVSKVSVSSRQTVEAINGRFAAQLSEMQRNLEHGQKAIEREVTAARQAQSNAEADIRRLEQWLRQVEPRLGAFEKITLRDFVWNAFLGLLQIDRSGKKG